MTERKGEKNRKIELGLKVLEGRVVDKNTMNTMIKCNQRNISFINKQLLFFVYNCFLYRVEKIERVVMDITSDPIR